MRCIHLPTGIAAESRTERSQHKNADVAMSLLKSKLYKIEEQKRMAQVEKQYDEKGEVAWGYQIRNYVLQPYTLVKDVRTETQTSQVQAVLDGEIDDFIQAFLRQKTEKEHKKKDEPKKSKKRKRKEPGSQTAGMQTRIKQDWCSVKSTALVPLGDDVVHHCPCTSVSRKSRPA